MSTDLRDGGDLTRVRTGVGRGGVGGPGHRGGAEGVVVDRIGGGGIGPNR